jgi:hypothetical protein
MTDKAALSDGERRGRPPQVCGPTRDRGGARRAAAAMLCVSMGLGVLCADVLGASPEPAIEGVRVGIGGAYKAGLWTPVVVTLRGGERATAGAVRVVVPDGDGTPSRVSTPPDQPCRLAPGEAKDVVLHARLGREAGRLTARFETDDGAVVEQTFQAGEARQRTTFPVAKPSREAVALLVGMDSAGVADATRGLLPHAGERFQVVRVDLAAALPRRWYGYEGVDLVVLGTSRPEVYAALRDDPAWLDALSEWVRMGGTVVLCGGEKSKPLLDAGGLLAPLVPGKFQRTQSLRQANAIEIYCLSAIAVARQASGGRIEIPCTQLSDVTGAVEAREGNLPLIVRQALGFGSVVFVAFDLDRAPLDKWADRPAFVGKLLGLPAPASEVTRQSDAVVHFGYTDLAGQLRSTLDQFPGIPAVPFWIVIGAVFGYLVVVGPLDYLFLRKVVGRMTFTWVTFPLVVVVAAVAAYVATARIKGDEIRVNQLDLIDVDAASGRLRGTCWANVFSPKVDLYDFSFSRQGLGGEKLEGPPALIGWLGLPGDSLGGMAPRTPSVSPWKEPYDFAPSLDSLSGVPMQIWTTKSLTARWTAPSKFRRQASLVERDRSLVGDVTNTLDFPLEDCLICYGRWAYRLDTLEPGQTATLTLSSERRDLAGYLTGRRLGDASRDPAAQYDRESTDPMYVLRAMMFYNAAGGFRYTGLTHRYQRFVDLSDSLRADRAILVGTVRRADRASGGHGAALLRDGLSPAGPRDRREAVYRIVFPVDRGNGP